MMKMNTKKTSCKVTKVRIQSLSGLVRVSPRPNEAKTLRRAAIRPIHLKIARLKTYLPRQLSLASLRQADSMLSASIIPGLPDANRPAPRIKQPVKANR